MFEATRSRVAELLMPAGEGRSPPHRPCVALIGPYPLPLKPTVSWRKGAAAGRPARGG